MPEPRVNDPSGVSESPVTITDPARTAEMVREFQRRMAYISSHYAFGKRVGLDDSKFNASHRRLQHAMDETRLASAASRSRIHPELELVISHLAKTHARDRSDIETGNVHAAMREVLDTVQPRRGRPRHQLLRHHVEGLMALFQEISRPSWMLCTRSRSTRRRSPAPPSGLWSRRSPPARPQAMSKPPRFCCR